MCPHNEHAVAALAVVVVSAYSGARCEQGTIAVLEQGAQNLPGRDHWQVVDKKERGPSRTKGRARFIHAGFILCGTERDKTALDNQRERPKARDVKRCRSRREGKRREIISKERKCTGLITVRLQLFLWISR